MIEKIGFWEWLMRKLTPMMKEIKDLSSITKYFFENIFLLISFIILGFVFANTLIIITGFVLYISIAIYSIYLSETREA